MGYSSIAQEYEVEKLKTISEIWGKCYLFHPSVIRSDKDLNWEKQFVEFLPKVKQINTSDQFIETINNELLAALEDPLTIVQSHHMNSQPLTVDMPGSNTLDYVQLSETILSDFEQLAYLDSIISDKTSSKPLIIDCRIHVPLHMDKHTYSPFKYFLSMCIDQEIYLSQSVSREHLGWDEYNDWWFYEQRWKIKNEDKDQKNNGKLLPFLAYQQDLQHKISNFNFNDFTPIKRPLYFIVNRSFLSYYQADLLALTANRNRASVIFEDAGRVFSGQQGIIKYHFPSCDFLLNTSAYMNNGLTDEGYALGSVSLSLDRITKIVQTGIPASQHMQQFPFQISPKAYKSPDKALMLEEKILGVIKTWTIVKYFYPYLNQCAENWETLLPIYLERVQETHSDREFYSLIQEMMAGLDDSHVSTYHSSILDFSAIFVAPVQFEWINEKVIVTAIDSVIQADICVGDEITAIDDMRIDQLLEKESKKISSSNRQGLLSTVINPGYFIGAAGSTIKFTIKRDMKKSTSVEIPRSTYVFQFMGFGDHRKRSARYDHNIGYLNLAALTNASELESELVKMRDTQSMILDLRNAYPTADYQTFLQMLCQNPVVTRNSKVPIISAGHEKVWQHEVSTIRPVSSFTYDKPIVVLIDKSMISRPEDIAVALKAFPNVTFVGEQTQGTDGEMTKIHLPGGGETSFTGQVIAFGDGKSFQKTGILPDIKVERTIEGIKHGKDEILQKAIFWLKNM